MSNYRLNRRGFLRISALATGAAVMAACGGSTPAPVTAPTSAPTNPPEATATKAAAAPTATTAAAAATEAPTAAATAAATTAATAAATEAAATTPAKYNEAPMLAELVKAGKLPAVDQRLPKDPVVLEPLKEVGKYGGTWHLADSGAWMIAYHYGAEGLVCYARDNKSIEPNICSKWDLSADGKEYTFHLRQGLRWSDGEPFNADDIMFWYNDVLLNKDLTPTIGAWLSPGGTPVVFTKVDDYTFKTTFATPYSIWLDQLAFNGVGICYYPAHYYKQFHVNYAKKDDLDKLTKDAGVEQWFQLFSNKGDTQRNPELPVMLPWKINSKDWTTTATGDRNPFYFKVDTSGNQLPYLDKISWIIVQDASAIPMKIVTGEVDHQAWSTDVSNYTLYMENRDKGGYDVSVWDYGGSGTAMHVNQAKQVKEGDDAAKEIRDLLKNLDFRTALSMAIDRDDINTAVYNNLSKPALEMFPDAVKNDAAIQKLYTLDADAANALLDGIGLTAKDADGMRLTKSGKALNLVMIGLPMYAVHKQVAQLIVEYWKEIGIRATMDWIAIELWWDRVAKGDYDIVAYEADYEVGNQFHLTYPRALFPVDPSTYWAGPWGAYYNSKGKSGEEPDDADGKKLQSMYDQALIAPSAADLKKILDEAFAITAKNLWPIHTVANRPEPNIVKKGFGNVPDAGTDWWPVYGERTSKPEQYFESYA